MTLFVLLGVVLVGCNSRLSNFDVGVAGDGQLDAVLERIADEQGLPALGAVLIYRGEVVELGAVGLRAIGSPQAVRITDRWHLGSNGKSMTATLAGVLVEEGVIDWDTTIGQALPDLAASIRREYVDVRLEELLSHTSGLVEDWMQIPSYRKSWESTKPLAEQRHQWAAELLALPPETARGKHHYANANYIVAGAMLESATGQSWEDLMQQKIFEPLGMTSTGFGVPGTVGDVADQPRGHRRIEGQLHALAPVLKSDNPAAVGPAGTVHSTLDDFARYLAAHLAGARGQGSIVSAKTFRKLHSPAPNTGYALGWRVGEHSAAGGIALSHNGSNGVWFARMWIAPKRDFAILTVTNIGQSAGAQGTDDALRALIDRCNAMIDKE